MDKRTLQLLLDMPPSMLRAWEAKHLKPGETIKDDVVKRMTRLTHLMVLVTISALVAAFAFVNVGTAYQANVFLVLGGVFFAFFGLAGGLTYLTRRRSEQWNILHSLQAAANDPALTGYSLIGVADSPQLRNQADKRLVWAAKTVLDAEADIERSRKDEKYSLSDLEAMLGNLRQFLATFDRMLAQAKEFSLNQGDERQYFEWAMRIKDKSIEALLRSK